MKKLLALVLCVVMVMSLAPAAFAGGYAVDDPLYSVAGYKKQIENMIKHTRENVEGAYKALVGDKVVYTSAKAMDDTVVDLVDAIANPLIEKGKVNKAWADGVKNAIRHYLDETVADKIADDYYKCLDKDGNVDDLKYAQLIANSINKALTDKKFVAGYQAVATYFALGQVVSDIKDNLKDEYEAFQDSIDPKFQARFAAQYTNLVDDYIDTLGTATLKVINADLAEVFYAEAVADAEDDYDAAVAAAGLVRDAAIDEADEAYDKALDKANKAYEDAVGDKRAAYEKKNAEASIDREYEEEMAAIKKESRDEEFTGYHDKEVKDAKDAYDAAMDAAAKLPTDRERAEAEAKAKSEYDKRVALADLKLEEDLNNISIDYEREMNDAKTKYEGAVKATKEAYENADKAATRTWKYDVGKADETYDAAVKDANEAYDVVEDAAADALATAIAEAAAEYGPEMVYEINPWAEVVYPTVGSPW